MPVNKEKGSVQKTCKQCRERWHNNLKPGVNPFPFSPEEELKMFELYNKHKNRWAKISKHFIGRTDNCIKNHYYSTLRKEARRLHKRFLKNTRAAYDLKPNEISIEYIRDLLINNNIPASSIHNKQIQKIITQMLNKNHNEVNVSYSKDPIDCNSDSERVIKTGKIFKIVKYNCNINDKRIDVLNYSRSEKEIKQKERYSKISNSLSIKKKPEIGLVCEKNNNMPSKSSKKQCSNIDPSEDEDNELMNLKLIQPNNDGSLLKDSDIDKINPHMEGKRENKYLLSFSKLLPKSEMKPPSLKFGNKNLEKNIIPSLPTLMNCNCPRIELPKLPNIPSTIPSNNLNLMNYFLPPGPSNNYFSPNSFVINPNPSSPFALMNHPSIWYNSIDLPYWNNYLNS